MTKDNMWQEWRNIKQEYQDLKLEHVIDYEKFCTMSIVWHSTKIEGCSLTETDTRVLLEQDITAAGKPLADHLMLKEHFIQALNDTEIQNDLEVFRNFILQQHIKFLSIEVEKYRNLNQDFLLMF